MKQEKIKRYDLGIDDFDHLSEVEDDEYGDWVLYSDHEDYVQELENKYQEAIKYKKRWNKLKRRMVEIMTQIERELKDVN